MGWESGIRSIRVGPEESALGPRFGPLDGDSNARVEAGPKQPSGGWPWMVGVPKVPRPEVSKGPAQKVAAGLTPYQIPLVA